MASADDILLRVEHLTMRFGGLVAVDDLSFEARRGNITALIGRTAPARPPCSTASPASTSRARAASAAARRCRGVERVRGADRQRQAPLRARTARSFCSSACRTIWSPSRRASPARSRTSACFPHDRAGEPAGRPAQRLMLASGYTLLAFSAFPPFAAAERAAIDKARVWLDRVGLTERADDPAGDLPYGAQRRLESRAPCAPTRCCSASTSRPPASIRAKAPTQRLLLAHPPHYASDPVDRARQSM